jgi:hypothetical protein
METFINFAIKTLLSFALFLVVWLGIRALRGRLKENSGAVNFRNGAILSLAAFGLVILTILAQHNFRFEEIAGKREFTFSKCVRCSEGKCATELNWLTGIAIKNDKLFVKGILSGEKFENEGFDLSAGFDWSIVWVSLTILMLLLLSMAAFRLSGRNCCSEAVMILSVGSPSRISIPSSLQYCPPASRY